MSNRDIVATALQGTGLGLITFGLALVAAWLALVVLGIGLAAFGIAAGRGED